MWILKPEEHANQVWPWQISARMIFTMDKLMDWAKGKFMQNHISGKEYDMIQEDMQAENRNSLLFFSIITMLFLLVMLLISFCSPLFVRFRSAYILLMLVELPILAGAYISKNKHPAILLFGMYAFEIMLYVFAVILGTVTQPQEQAASIVAFLLTVPLLFTDKPFRMICSIGVGVVLFILTAIKVKDKSVLFVDIVDVVVFGILGAILGTHAMRVKCQRLLFARKVSILSETDMLTGLRNRNAYEQKLHDYASLKNCEIASVYVDVNGLHEINNTKGHAAGDQMLRYIGKTVQNEFGEMNSFRIGGDEFVVLLIDEPEDRIRAKIEQIRKQVEKESYHVSIGCSVGNTSDKNISSLIVEAEKRMYEDKRLYYQNSGKDRRARI